MPAPCPPVGRLAAPLSVAHACVPNFAVSLARVAVLWLCCGCALTMVWWCWVPARAGGAALPSIDRPARLSRRDGPRASRQHSAPRGGDACRAAYACGGRLSSRRKPGDGHGLQSVRRRPCRLGAAWAGRARAGAASRRASSRRRGGGRCHARWRGGALGESRESLRHEKWSAAGGGGGGGGGSGGGLAHWRRWGHSGDLGGGPRAVGPRPWHWDGDAAAIYGFFGTTGDRRSARLASGFGSGMALCHSGGASPERSQTGHVKGDASTH